MGNKTSDEFDSLVNEMDHAVQPQEHKESSPPLQLIRHGGRSKRKWNESFIEVDPKRVRAWKGHDRTATKWYSHESRAFRELAENIKKNGQLEPALGRRLDGDPCFEIELIYGMRRRAACEYLKQPLKVRICAISDEEAAVKTYSENRFREDITPMERAFFFHAQMKLQVFESQEALSEAMGLKKSSISKMILAADFLHDETLNQLFADKSVLPVERVYRLRTLSEQNDARDKLIRIAGDLMRSTHFGQMDSRSVLELLAQKLSETTSFPVVRRAYGLGSARKLNVTRDVRQRVTFCFPQSRGGLSLEQTVEVFRRALTELDTDDVAQESVQSKLGA